MKRNLIFKLITGSVITTTLFTGISFKANGEWKVDGQGNYYFNEGNGYSSGWRNIDGIVYYFNNNGVMQKGWINYNGSWYFLDSNGILKTGWIEFNNNWYYSNSAGVMQTGIINVNGKTYYLADNGVMQKKNMIIDGKFYTIGNDGSIVGSNVPAPNKIFDMFGTCIQSDSSSDSNNISPIESMNSQELTDTSEVGDYNAPTRKFTVSFRDYNGEEIDKKTVKEGNTVKTIDADSRDGYSFVEWNTKGDGSGKGYDEDEKVKVTSDLNLYAIYKEKAEETPVSAININGDTEVEIGKKVQLNAEVKPSSATNTKVKWSVVNGTGEADIDANTGIIEGKKAGTIIVSAAADDGSGTKSKDYEMKVVEAKNLAESITISAPSTSINTNNGTLQLTADIKPDNVTSKKVKWILNGSGSKYASVDEDTGLVTAISNGEIEVVAKATDGSGKMSSPFTITITNQEPKLERINISTANKIDKISRGKTIDINASLTPDSGLSAEQSELKWTAKYITGTNKGKDVQFTKNSNTQITLTGTEEKGDIEVRAVSANNSQIYSSRVIHVIQDAESIKVIAKEKDASGKEVSKEIGSAQEGQPIITEAKVTTEAAVLYLCAEIGPEDTDTKGIKWSIKNDNENDNSVIAVLSSTNDLHPTLTAKKNGNVTIRATANDNSKVYGELKVEIAGQPIKATSINIDKITLTRGSETKNLDISSDIEAYTGDIFEFEAHVDDKATNKNITWAVAAGKNFVEEKSKDSNKFVVEVKEPGTFRIMAASDNGAGITTTKDIRSIRKASSMSISSTMSIDSSVPSEYKVAQGKEIDLIATVYPTDALGSDVTWTVTNVVNDGVARLEKLKNQSDKNVSSQTFTATEIGEVMVTAEHKTGYKSTKKVIILPLTQTIDVSSSEDNIQLGKSESKEIQMTAVSNSGNGAYDKYKWTVTTSNKNITANISDTGYLSITRTGDISDTEKIYVKAAALDGSGQTAAKTITVIKKNEADS